MLTIPGNTNVHVTHL